MMPTIPTLTSESVGTRAQMIAALHELLGTTPDLQPDVDAIEMVNPDHPWREDAYERPAQFVHDAFRLLLEQAEQDVWVLLGRPGPMPRPLYEDDSVPDTAPEWRPAIVALAGLVACGELWLYPERRNETALEAGFWHEAALRDRGERACQVLGWTGGCSAEGVVR